MRTINAYHANHSEHGHIVLERALPNREGCKSVDTWGDAIKWLVYGSEDQNCFNVVYSLHDFTRKLFSLLPEEVQNQLKDQERVFYDNTKIFYVPQRYLGLTLTTALNEKANRYAKYEINLYQLQGWLDNNTSVPTNAKKVKVLGQNILSALNAMGIYPTKLTSPAAVLADNYLVDARAYPTIWSCSPNCISAMDYATNMMRFEWRSAYQLGYFPKTQMYDITSAYPASIMGLPSTDDCMCDKSDTVPSWSQWGIMHGTVDVTEDVSPLVYDAGDSCVLNLKGKWTGYFNTKEIDWLTRNQAGHFEMTDGWFFKFSNNRPYRNIMCKLFEWKQSEDPLISVVAKRMAQGMSGKLDEDRMDGTVGDFYNPILASMVRSHCRIKVADFIYQHKLQDSLIAVLVDSVLYDGLPLDIPADASGMGRWRYEDEAPAIVLSKGNIYRPGKTPGGVSFQSLFSAIKAHPEYGYYNLQTEGGNSKTLDLMINGIENDRVYEHELLSGQDILDGTVKSKPFQKAGHYSQLQPV